MPQVRLDILLSLVDKASGALGNVRGALNGLEQRLQTGQKQAAAFDEKWQATLSTAQQTGSVMQMAGAGATRMGQSVSLAGGAVLAGFGMAAKGAADFDAGLREVSTLVDESVVDMGQLKAAINTTAAETGQSAQGLTSALYQAISAGVDAGKSQEFLGVAAKAAVGGVTDVTTAVNGITNVLNAWKMETEDASKVSDAMFTAVKAGKTTFGELSDSLFNVAPAAAAANVGMEEVMAAISTLTASGTPTSVATTQIRAALVGLMRPSEEMSAIFKKLGYDSAESAVKSRGLKFALDAVMQASGGSSGKLQQLLGSTEAVSAAQVLAGTGASKFAADIEAQAKAAGASEEAFKKMAKGSSVQFAQFKEQLASIARAAGDAVLPAMNALLAILKPIVSVVSAIAQTPLGRVLFILAAGAAASAVAFGGMLMLAGQVLSGIGGFMTALPQLITLYNTLSGAIGANGAAGAMGLLKSSLAPLMGRLTAMAGTALPAVQGAISAMGASLSGVAAAAGPIAIAIIAIAALAYELYKLKQAYDSAAKAGEEANKKFKEVESAEDAYAAKTGTQAELAKQREERENAKVTVGDRFWGAMTGGGRTSKDIAMERVAMGQAIPVAGKRAAGGPVLAGGMYLVGENGPELFRPKQSGEIEDADATRLRIRAAKLDAMKRPVLPGAVATAGAASLTSEVATTKLAAMKPPVLSGAGSASLASISKGGSSMPQIARGVEQRTVIELRLEPGLIAKEIQSAVQSPGTKQAIVSITRMAGAQSFPQNAY